LERCDARPSACLAADRPLSCAASNQPAKEAFIKTEPIQPYLDFDLK